MTDSSGVVKWSADYKPFGEATIDQTVTTITNNLRFPGQYFDAETGLHYNYFRDYNPAIGRLTETDQIGLRGGFNLYAYVGNNPLYWFDPYGLDATSWGGDGRSIADGPKNGNWGGKNWSGGWNPNKHGGKDGPGVPTDSGDECYKSHDICYGVNQTDCGKKKCDAILVDCLKKLSSDSKKWPHSSKAGTESDTEKFKDDAIWYFK